MDLLLSSSSSLMKLLRSSLSHTNGIPIAQYETLLRLAVMLYDNSHIQPEDIRGIGLLLKNLVSQVNISVFKSSIERIFFYSNLFLFFFSYRIIYVTFYSYKETIYQRNSLQ